MTFVRLLCFIIGLSAFGAVANDYIPGTVTGGQAPATSTNDNACSTCVGYMVSSSIPIGSEVTLSASGTAYNITSISLAAGDWEVEALICYSGASTTSFTYLQAWISTSSASTPTEPNNGAEFYYFYPSAYTPGAGVFWCQYVGRERQSLSTTTTEYLEARAGYTSTAPFGYGYLRARRVR